MVQNKDFSELDAKQEQLIYSLLKHSTKVEAARKAGIPHNTMYRWLRDPAFKAAYRAALRDRFQDCMATLEKNSAESAQALVDMVADLDEDSSVRVNAAKAMIDRAFRAQDTIAMEEEMDHLRTTLAALKAAAAAKSPVAEVRNNMVNENEQAEADLLRVTWMTEIGNNAQAIQHSLRYNRPQSVAAESQLLDIVRKSLEEEKKYTDVVSPP